MRARAAASAWPHGESRRRRAAGRASRLSAKFTDNGLDGARGHGTLRGHRMVWYTPQPMSTPGERSACGSAGFLGPRAAAPLAAAGAALGARRAGSRLAFETGS